MLAGFVRALVLAGAVLIGTSAAQAQKSFVRDDLASEAVRLEERVRTEAAAARDVRPAAELRREFDLAMNRGDPRRALALATAAAAAEPRVAANWMAYARAANAVNPRDWSERYQLQERATTAAYLAYQRATTRADEATSLALLGETYANRQFWRYSLQAYRASLQLAEAAPVRAAYQDLREKHGFRLLDYQVDSDSASPRVCFRFSEPLRGKVDYTPFLAVTGATNLAVTAEGVQLCAEGLRHGERYGFVVRQGLPSSVDEDLLRSADYEIYVRDRSPQVRFTGRNYVLPRTGQEGIPVVSVNTGRVEVEVYRIGDRNLLPTLRSDNFLSQISASTARTMAREKGVRIWSGSLDTPLEQNRDVVTAFPVLEAVGSLEPGVYVMTARPPGAGPRAGEDEEYDWGMRATQWFVVSDLGLTAFKGADGVHVFVRSLASAAPLSGTEIRLVARNNEILATKRTDARGHVAFDPGLARGEGGLAPGLVVATTGEDYGFLDFNQNAFDLSDRGVKGRPAGRGVEAYLYAERGVYRSGETVFLSALLRDARGAAVSGLPLTLVVQRPDGVEYRRTQVADQGLGGRALSVPIVPNAMRGTWRVTAYTDPKAPAVGDTSFLVEDYVPERIELTLAPKAPTLRPGEPAVIDLEARYLYGAPAANLEVSGEVTVRAGSGPAVPGLEGFVVGLEDEAVEATTAEIEDKGTTDAQGRATMQVNVPDLVAPRPTEARIALRVAEEGGRAIERTVVLPIRPKGPVLGIRKNFRDDLAEGANATFDLVLATPEGQRLARAGVTWRLYRVSRRYQWFNSDGRWGFEPVTTTRRIAEGTADIGADAPGRVSVPVEWGSYRLEARAEGIETAQTSVSFTVGWSGDATADVPDLLPMTLDKTAYAAGETMRLRLSPRYAGKATVAVVGERVNEIRVLDVAPEGTLVTIPVDPAWGTGAYVVALAHRPLDQAARRLPGRSLGVAWFEIDRAGRSLSLDLGAPAQMRPRGEMRLPIRLAGLRPGEEARVTVAAVDVGILNLTRYQAPDPVAFFYGQRQLGTEIRDLYGYLIDGMQGTRGAIRSGGDTAAPTLADTPPNQEPLARFSGVVTVGPDGTAEVAFDIPAFNGTVRVMGVAWTRDRAGSASADVIVRDPVVLAGTLPRFLSVGDRSRIHVEIDNVEGAAAEYTVDVDVRGPVVIPADALRRTVRLERGGKANVTIPITAAGAGMANFELTLSGPGLEAGQSFAMRVQPGSAGQVRRTVRPLEANGSLTLSNDLLADILPGTGSVSVSVSPLAALDVPGLLQALDRFPYGCSEQIVSRALPLLYVNRLAAREALALDANVDERIRNAIERVLARQSSNGAFGLWSVGGDDIWLDAYVTDFLTRARERGFTVPQTAFTLALDRLRNFVANTTEVESRAADLAYAAYVLARNGRPVMGDLRYLADTRLSEFKTPLSRGQIGAALALLGDRGRSERIFANAVEQLRSLKDDGLSRPDYGTRLRDAAGLLALGAEANLSREATANVVRVVADERAARRYTSTQENAWMILAAEGFAAQADGIAVSVDGVPHKGAFQRTFAAEALDRAPVVLANAGPAAQVVVNVTGNPIGPEPAESRGYAVERSYYRLDGTQVDPARVRQNDRLVTVLKVSEPEAKFARVLLVDRLPAGFEIDNPKLVDSGSVGALDWLKHEVEAAHTEYRDDRFVAAYDRAPGQPAIWTAAYMVRVVAPGRYVHPPAVVEDMYRPDRFGRTGFGTVEVAPVR